MSERRAGVLVSRVVHGAISVLFLACIGIVWWSAISGEVGALTLVAIALLLLEGALVLLAGGNCPLEGFWRLLGDETPFFELIVGPRLAPHAIPALAAVSLAAIAVIAARTLL